MKYSFIPFTQVFLCAAFLTCYFPAKAQDDLHEPSIAEVLSLKGVGNPQISPDGNHVAFTMTRTDWKENRYDTEIWLSKNGEAPFQLTNYPDGSSTSPQWTPDSKWITFRSKRGEKTQIYAISLLGGEAYQLTREEETIGNFSWSPDGTQLAFLLSNKDSKEDKREKETLGAFGVDQEEFTHSHLWVMEVDLPMEDPSNWPCLEADSSDCREWPQARQLTKGDFHVNGFSWSPTGTHIAINRQPNSNLLSFMDADIFLYEVATGELNPLVENSSVDEFITWSPDGSWLLYTSDLDNDTANFYTNSSVYMIDIASRSSSQILTGFDENPFGFSWTPLGIFFRANQKTETQLFFLDDIDGSPGVVPAGFDQVGSAHFSKDGQYVAFTASTGKDLFEIYRTPVQDWKGEPLTQMSKQIENWKYAQSEVIEWESTDGRKIEGVLHTPHDFDPTKKYPLLVRIHGGPTGVDRPSPVPAYVYPALQWLNKGCLILRPNYRGSAGYGAEFRAANVRNLGVGDAWDVLSGVDHLIAKGIVDTSRMGAMGWSQGGYISAFLTTTSHRFKAISVGAGISDWMTYYVNTDIHPFTRQYLKADPWSDPDIYAKTSPMTYINQASTPTLIQHGEFDQRVPIPNAYQLYQGLQDRNIPSKLIVYKGFGHGITKPKERLAATWHNYLWFGKHVWGEDIPIPFLTIKEEDKD